MIILFDISMSNASGSFLLIFEESHMVFFDIFSDTLLASNQSFTISKSALTFQ